MNNRSRAIGVGLVVLGALLLLGRWIDVGAFAWPLFIIGPGLLMLAFAFLGNRDAAGLAVPGSIVTTVGLILFVQNATDTFESWSYAWALVLAAVGVGTFLKGAIEEGADEQKSGLQLVALGLTLFAGFGVFFEFFIFTDGSSGWLGRLLMPLVLIGIGAYLLLGRGADRSAARPPEADRSGEDGS